MNKDIDVGMVREFLGLVGDQVMCGRIVGWKFEWGLYCGLYGVDF